MPSNWDKLQVTRPTSRVNSSISARSDDPNSGDTLLGINCRGSGRCVSCETDMPFLQTITDQIGTSPPNLESSLALRPSRHLLTCSPAFLL